jgi:hypothetical protein
MSNAVQLFLALAQLSNRTESKMTYTVIVVATGLGVLVALTNVTGAEDTKPEQPKVCAEGYTHINGECVKQQGKTKTYDFGCIGEKCNQDPAPDARRPTVGTPLTRPVEKK